MDDGDAAVDRIGATAESAHLAVDQDAAFFGKVFATQYLEQGRFSGAVFAEQTVYATGRNREADIGKRANAGEGFPDGFERQKTGHKVLPPLDAPALAEAGSTKSARQAGRRSCLLETGFDAHGLDVGPRGTKTAGQDQGLGRLVVLDPVIH